LNIETEVSAAGKSAMGMLIMNSNLLEYLEHVIDGLIKEWLLDIDTGYPTSGHIWEMDKVMGW
jgi:hypothetical protein